MDLSPTTRTVQSAKACGFSHSSQIAAPAQVAVALVVLVAVRLSSRL